MALPCWHLSVHTFTPLHRGKVRVADVGILFGYQDGFTSNLRKNFSDINFLGIGLEVNQKIAKADRSEQWAEIQSGMAHCLKVAVDS